MDGLLPSARPTQSWRDRTRWLTGEGSYVADLPAADALAAAFLRAPYAHAEIAAIDTAPARALPGVVAVLTGEACIAAGFGNFCAMMHYGADGPRPLVVPRRPVLAEGRVRHVGELVACVVARTPAIAADAVEAIVVDYRPLPAPAAGARCRRRWASPAPSQRPRSTRRHRAIWPSATRPAMPKRCARPSPPQRRWSRPN